MKAKLAICLIILGLLLTGCKANKAGVSKAGESSAVTSVYSSIDSDSSEAPETFKVKSTVIIIESAFKLNGILCTPEGVENPPVVIMVQVSGQSDYDETVSAAAEKANTLTVQDEVTDDAGAAINKPFKDIAEGLAKHGIASIRYNKRYYQYAAAAAEKVNTLTVQDEVTDDAGAAIAFAKQHEATKNSKIYVLGHSLGGMLAPYIASINTDVSGIVVLAGSPRKLEDIMLDQNKEALKTITNKTESEKQQLLEEIEKYVNMVKNLKEGEPSVTLFGCPSSYWLSLNKIDTPKIANELEIPMMILQGSADFQVYPEIDYKAWQDLLSGHTNVTFKLYDDLNHLFIKTNGKKDTSEYDVKGNVEPQVLKDIADWIKSNG